MGIVVVWRDALQGLDQCQGRVGGGRWIPVCVVVIVIVSLIVTLTVVVQSAAAPKLSGAHLRHDAWLLVRLGGGFFSTPFISLDLHTCAYVRTARGSVRCSHTWLAHGKSASLLHLFVLLAVFASLLFMLTHCMYFAVRQTCSCWACSTGMSHCVITSFSLFLS